MSGKIKVWPCRVSFKGEGDVLILARTQEDAIHMAHIRRFDANEMRNIRLEEVDVADIGAPLGNAPNQDGEPVQLRLPFEEDQ